jgi:tetratricopeptide (TPR) repeat protein
MTESDDLKSNLTLALDDLLKGALMPGEQVAISLNGSFGEGIAATNQRVIILREATTIGAKQQEQVFPYALADVQSVTMSASDVAGQLVLEIAESEGRVPPVERRSVGFPVAQFETFEKAAQEIERMALSAREGGAEETAAEETTAGEAALACGSCGAAIQRGYLYCPQCGQQLWMLCAGCNAPIEEGWQFCVTCGRSLAGESADPRTLRRVLTMHARRDTQPASPKEEPAAEEPPAPAKPAEPPAETEESAEQANRRGVDLYEQGELEDAIAAFKHAIQLDPAQAKYYTNLGVAYGDADATDSAKDAYAKALALNPNDTSAMLYMGGLMAEENDHDKARELWERVIAMAPNTPEAREARNNLIGLDNL